MKKIYENMDLKVVFFSEDDIVRTSSADNVVDMPEFPEDFTGNN